MVVVSEREEKMPDEKEKSTRMREDMERMKRKGKRDLGCEMKDGVG